MRALLFTGTDEEIDKIVKQVMPGWSTLAGEEVKEELPLVWEYRGFPDGRLSIIPVDEEGHRVTKEPRDIRGWTFAGGGTMVRIRNDDLDAQRLSDTIQLFARTDQERLVVEVEMKKAREWIASLLREAE